MKMCILCYDENESFGSACLRSSPEACVFVDLSCPVWRPSPSLFECVWASRAL